MIATATQAQTPATKVYGLKVVDTAGVIYVQLSTSVANSAQIILDDGQSAPLSAVNTASLIYNNNTKALQASVNGGAYLAITTGNWTFTGNNADLSAADTMGIALTTATAISMGHAGIDTTITGGNGFWNIGVGNIWELQSNGVVEIVWSQSLTALYSVVDGGTNLGQSGNRWGTIDVFNIAGGSPPAALDTSASNVTWTGQPGSAASVSGGGVGAAITVIGGIGGNGLNALNPGNGGAGQIKGGNCGTGGSGNCSGGNFVGDGGIGRGTGHGGLVLIGTLNASQITMGGSNQTLVNSWNSGTGALNLTAGAASTWQTTGAFTLTVQGGAAGGILALRSPTGSITVGTATENVINIGNAGQPSTTTFAGTLVFPAGSISDAALASTFMKASTGTAADLPYFTGTGAGPITRLATPAAGQVLVSGTTPAYSANPTVTSVTNTAGTGTQTGIVPSDIFSSATVTGSSNSAPVNTLIFSMPGNTLSANGQWLDWDFGLTHTNNTDLCTFTGTFAGTTVATASFALTSEVYAERIRIVRLTPTTARATALGWTSTGSLTNAATVSVTGLDYTGTITMQVTLPTTTSNNDCSSEYAHVTWHHN